MPDGSVTGVTSWDQPAAAISRAAGFGCLRRLGGLDAERLGGCKEPVVVSHQLAEVAPEPSSSR